MITKSELTEREKKYLDYWINYKEILPIKVVMIIAWSSILIYFFVGVIVIYCDNSEMTMSDYLAFFVFPICFALIMAGLTKPLLNRIKKRRICEYEVHRTKILSKEVYYQRLPKGGSYPLYCYRCKGIDEQIVPISKKLYNMAESGDDITVVRLQDICVGITFSKDMF